MGTPAVKSFAGHTALAASSFAVNIQAEMDSAEKNSPGVLTAAADFELVEAAVQQAEPDQLIALNLLEGAQTDLLLSLPPRAAWLAWLELRYAG